MGDETHHRKSESYIKKGVFLSLHKIGNANGISLKMGRQWYFEDFFPCKFNQAIILLNAQRNSLLEEPLLRRVSRLNTKFHSSHIFTKLISTYFKSKASISIV